MEGGISVGAEALSLSGTGASSNGALQNVSGNNTFGGAITLAADTEIQSDAGTLTLSNTTGSTITGTNTNLTFDGAGNTAVSGVISTGTGTLTKNGAGNTTLSGSSANTYSGTTTVNNGELDLNKTSGVNATGTGSLTIGDSTGLAGTAVVKLLVNNQISDSSAVTIAADGQFNVNGKTETIGSLAGSGTVALGAGALTTGGSNATTSYSGVISGTGSLTKAGTGTMTLSNVNTFTGATTVSAGTLALTVANALSASSDVTVASGATLTAGAGNSQEFHSLSGAGTVTLGTGADLAIDAASASFTGTLNLDGATLTLNGITLGNGMTLNVTGNSVIDFAGNSTLNLASLNLAAGATLQIKNWVYGQDFFFDTGTLNGSSVNTVDPGTGPLADINFDGFTNSTDGTGNPTGWRSWSTPGNQIAPVPEPATYGALLLGAGVTFVALRRRRRTAEAGCLGAE